METDEQDDESSQDQELPSENEHSQSEDSVGGDNELENGTVTSQNSTKGQQSSGHGKKRLFTFQLNNTEKTDFSLAKEDARQIRFDDGHLRLNGRTRGPVLRSRGGSLFRRYSLKSVILFQNGLISLWIGNPR